MEQPPLDAPRIDGIQIIELLGKGGMSLVYKAKQSTMERFVAVKVLSKISSEEGIKRFKQEARNTSSLDHPNIVKTISFGISQDNRPYLVLEYLQGVSLYDELKQNGRLTLEKFRGVFLPALSALAQAHEAGLVHRDIKPANIMICREASDEVVKLVDFGIAKLYSTEAEAQGLTKTGEVIGSPAYMSPEQCLGKPLDGRSDLYSLACVMYECLSGEPPFSGSSALEVMQQHHSAPAPTVSELSRKIDIRKELASVTLWGLNKDPAKRPQTASEFMRKLSEVLEKITLDKIPQLKDKNYLSRQSRQVLALSSAAITAVGAFALATVYMKKKGASDSSSVIKIKQHSVEDKEVDAPQFLRKLAAEFDPKTHSFAGADAQKWLDQLNAIVSAKPPKLQGVSLYAAYVFLNELQKIVQSPWATQLDTLNQALKYSKNDLGKETEESAYVHFKKWVIYFTLKDYAKQIDEINSSIKLLEANDTASLPLPSSFQLTKNVKTLGDCYSALAITNEQWHKYDMALANYDKSLSSTRIQPMWKIESIVRKVKLLKQLGRDKQADKSVEDFIEMTKHYIPDNFDANFAIAVPQAQNAVSALGKVGDGMERDGFPDYAKTFYLANRRFAKQIHSKEEQHDAEQRLLKLEQK